MPLSVLCTTLLALIWTQAVHSRPEDHHHTARIRITWKKSKFSSFNLPNAHRDAAWKLVKDPTSSKIYAGASHGLYEFNPEKKPPGVTQEALPIFKNECNGSGFGCERSISVVTEGKNGNSLFVCGKEVKKCCKVDSGYNPLDCFEMQESAGDVNESALYIGDTLYFTISGESSATATLGLYRQKAKQDYTWPQTRDIAQKYVKIIADESNAAKDGKLYNFYIEKNQNKDPETPFWIPRVSRYCMSDTGGSKNQLQYRWTSMLTARLFCGDKKMRVTFTELLDVAVLDPKNWNNTMVYALFRNDYNMTAVCIYKMSEITRIFASGKFKASTESLPQQAGECVSDKSTGFLKFMEKRPEMEEWIESERGPLLVGHRQYTHLQVDSVTGNNVNYSVLFLTLGCGRIHKVVELDNGPFIIAEYEPFENKAHIQSMLLDKSTKTLYVSSSSELVQIDLKNCSIYGVGMCDCVLARDPYCAWNGTACSPDTPNVRIEDKTVCKEESSAKEARRSVRSEFELESPLMVPPNSKYYLQCPVSSLYASYTWKHNNKKKDCVSSQQECLLLIEKISEEDLGWAEENHLAADMHSQPDMHRQPIRWLPMPLRQREHVPVTSVGLRVHLSERACLQPAE
ncbi:hypothetical protein AOLI_G00101430 [Acnodon oligacanthus]